MPVHTMGLMMMANQEEASSPGTWQPVPEELGGWGSFPDAEREGLDRGFYTKANTVALALLTAGRRVRFSADGVTWVYCTIRGISNDNNNSNATGMAVGPGNSHDTIQFNADASGVDDFYLGQVITCSVLGVPRLAREIVDYYGPAGGGQPQHTAFVSYDWSQVPDPPGYPNTNWHYDTWRLCLLDGDDIGDNINYLQYWTGS